VARSTDSYNVAITIPEGYAVEYLPKSKTVDNRETTMVYSAAVNGNTINVTAQFVFKNGEYPPSDYNLLKKYYGDMITMFSDNIILIRQ
jgi:hypothetical protein